MKRVIALILAFLILTSGIGTASASAGSAGRNINISYRFASKQEGTDLLLGNTAYYAGFSQNDLDYRMHRQGAAMEEYLAFAKEQVLDFTEAEKELIASHMAILTAGLEKNAWRITLPLRLYTGRKDRKGTDIRIPKSSMGFYPTCKPQLPKNIVFQR